MTTNLRRLVWGCALSMCMCVPAAMAQNVTGSITGEVTDPSGAVVSGAQVVAHNLDTGSTLRRPPTPTAFIASTSCRPDTTR